MDAELMKTFLFLLFHFAIGLANSVVPRPQSDASFSLNYIQNVGSCSFTVVITTSCSSTSYTRDQISLAFGDAYGNQVYAPRLGDPSSGTFERCSSDTFLVTGPCTYQICYAYFYRSGYDGWKPESVTIYGYNTRAVTFYIRTFIPGDIWYGVNLCSSTSSGRQIAITRCFILFYMLQMASYIINASIYEIWQSRNAVIFKDNAMDAASIRKKIWRILIIKLHCLDDDKGALNDIKAVISSRNIV